MNLKRFFSRRILPKWVASSGDDGGARQSRRNQRRKIMPQAAPPDLSGVDGIWAPGGAPPATGVFPVTGVVSSAAAEGKSEVSAPETESQPVELSSSETLEPVVPPRADA